MECCVGEMIWWCFDSSETPSSRYRPTASVPSSYQFQSPTWVSFLSCVHFWHFSASFNTVLTCYMIQFHHLFQMSAWVLVVSDSIHTLELLHFNVLYKFTTHLLLLGLDRYQYSVSVSDRYQWYWFGIGIANTSAGIGWPPMFYNETKCCSSTIPRKQQMKQAMWKAPTRRRYNRCASHLINWRLTTTHSPNRPTWRPTCVTFDSITAESWKNRMSATLF